MDLRQLKYFLAVVEQGSFSRAAESLHLSQPPLSIAIKRLEREVGVELLVRTSHGAEPTEAGRYLERSGRRLLQHLADIERTLRGLGQGIEGQLRLAVVPSFSWEHLPPLVTEYTREAPDVEVILSDPPPDQVLRSVLDGIADVGIVACADTDMLGATYSGELHVVRASSLPLLAALPPRFADSADRVDLVSLESERWFIPAPSPRFPGLPELIETIWARHSIHPKHVRSVSTLQTAIPLIAAGSGITLIPASIRQIAQSSVVTREVLQPIPPLEAAVVWSAADEPAPAVQRFLNLALGMERAGRG